MNRIKQLRKMHGYTQAKLAELLHVSRSAVAMWETTPQRPDPNTLREISQSFNVPTDFILGSGVFSQWDDIKDNYEAVVRELKEHIPADFKLPVFCEDKPLTAWLEARLRKKGDANDELQLVRWFSFAVKRVALSSIDGAVSASIRFTPELLSLLCVNNADSLLAAIKIPVFGTISADVPLEATKDIVDWVELPGAMTSTDHEYFALQVRGDSMWPTYLPSDIVIVQKAAECISGDTCVVFINGYNAILRQVKLSPNGSITLIPHNQSYAPHTYSAEEAAALPVSIAGVAVELRRKIKTPVQ